MAASQQPVASLTVVTPPDRVVSILASGTPITPPPTPSSDGFLTFAGDTLVTFDSNNLVPFS